jgi:hypothetical protein
MPVPQDAESGDWSNPFQEGWAERARLVGEEEVDGRMTKVLIIDDFSELELPGLPGAGEGDEDVEPKAIRFWMDDDDLLMRKMELEAEARAEDGSLSPVLISMVLEDYREVGGYIHPFVMRANTKGMMEAADVDPEEMRAQLAQLRQQLADMPEAQRAMVEGMLQGQIDMLEEMLGGEEGMEMTVTVTDLKVNAGPPGGE